jgi:K+-sensing histidine kinase KdpD
VFHLFYENESIISFNESVDPMSEMYGLVVLIYLVAYLICLFFLYKFKKVGKQMYLFLFILGVLLSILLGDSAQSSIAYVVDGLGWANAGAILSLLYFSSIKKEF